MTKLRLPKVLNICGHTIKIIYKKKLFHNGSECWGLYDTEKEIIYLKMGMTRSQKSEIVLHEAIHAIEHINNINISEQGVKNLSIGLLGLIKNNKVNFL